MASRIEDYALIGDCKTAALVSISGSIDWLCLPRFDSPACFASLLGSEENGTWTIAPAETVTRTTRDYIDGSLTLRTVFETATGSVELIDTMPIDGACSHIIRQVRGLRGEVPMHLKFIVRFNYGVDVPWIERADQTTLSIIAGPHMLVLRAPINIEGEDLHSVADFTVAEGECIPFVLSYGPSYLPRPEAIDVDAYFQKTMAFWNEWSGRCADVGQYSAIVKRSLVTLKGLTYLPTGGIVAAPTTSLPEMIGGERNWDYRYCWLRDATFTLLVFLNAGYQEEAHAFRDWLLRAIAGSPDQMQIMYGLAGERELIERELHWLAGYESSKPVRVGNGAFTQTQLDIYGEVFNTMAVAAKGGLMPTSRSASMRGLVLDRLEKIWMQPDEGIWEIRGPAQHFTHSKVMAWVAFDRAAQSDYFGADAPMRARYRDIADRIHESVCANAVDPERNCFTQFYGGGHMDASLLLIPVVGFLPPEDPRIRNTVAQIEKHLLVNGLVLRYETENGIDGLPPGEGAFLACSFWLVDNYVLQGRLADAKALFQRLASFCNDVGLLSEEYDPVAKRQLGNFPQAFSHVAMVNSAYALAEAEAASPLGHNQARRGK